MLAIHTHSKTKFTDHSKQRMIAAVAKSARGVTRLLPIIAFGKIVAWMCSDHWPSRGVYVIDHKPWMDRLIDKDGFLCGFVTVDDLILNMTTNGKMLGVYYIKGFEANSTEI